MKKTMVGLLLGLGCVTIFPGSPAMAIDLYGFGSYWDKDETDGKWGGGLGLSLPLFTEHIKLDGRAYFFENSTLGDDDELKLLPFDLGVQLHLLPDSEINPYALGGLSYIYADAEKFDIDSDFGFYLGGGLEWAIVSSSLKLFGEVVYRFSELEAEGEDDDIDVSGITGNVGLKINF